MKVCLSTSVSAETVGSKLTSGPRPAIVSSCVYSISSEGIVVLDVCDVGREHAVSKKSADTGIRRKILFIGSVVKFLKKSYIWIISRNYFFLVHSFTSSSFSDFFICLIAYSLFAAIDLSLTFLLRTSFTGLLPFVYFAHALDVLWSMIRFSRS